MRRWNGWGDDGIDYRLPANARTYLAELVGKATPPIDATLADVVCCVPPSRLPLHPLINTDSRERVLHARGQSLPDWVALRSGRIPVFPDGVARPNSAEDVTELLYYGRDAGVRVIPYGGGTSVVGHITPQPGDAPVLTVNLRRLNQLRHFDETSRLATFGAGADGPEVEAQLRARGYTLGHFPQSFEQSTLGGWVVTRSSGQQSLGYGRIEDLFAGGRLVAPTGELVLPTFPASAAGPDLRHLVLGSEGRMGILIEATVRVTPLPEREAFHVVFFPDFESGMMAVRQIVQEGLPLSLLRLSTPVETTTTLALTGHELLIGLLERMLAVRNVAAEKCMLLMGFTGRKAAVRQAQKAALDITSALGGVHVGRRFGEQWIAGRFRTPYLRNTLWEQGYAIDTLETAATWDKIPALLGAIETALKTAIADSGERVHVFTHLSHMYPQGASIYTTYLFRIAPDPDETLQHWRLLKSAASQAIVAGQGTISHQHGVGLDHTPYLTAEKGILGVQALHDAFRRFDPDGIMNPGKLLPSV